MAKNVMEYRINRRTGDKISALGFGTGYLADVGKSAVDVLRCAYEGGINYYDLATSYAATYEYFREALGDVRKNIMIQAHFGNSYRNGGYAWTTNSDTIKRTVEWQLKTLNTDYIDYGFIHCLDETSDWNAYKKGGALRFLLDMHEQGVVRHLGLSSHTPAAARKVMEEVPLDMLMFSINPAYDYQQGDYGIGSVSERTALYQKCQAEGIGITVMKPFCGGQLLSAKHSPFGVALNHYQCVNYALDRPGVLTILPGMTTVQQVKHLLGFFQASDTEKDYSVISTFKPADAVGKCVYCNHCQPCPAELDVGMINKFYDLSAHGDPMAIEHYKALDKHAEDCIECGHCNSRCPFGVDQLVRMKEIAAFFTERGVK